MHLCVTIVEPETLGLATKASLRRDYSLVVDVEEASGMTKRKAQVVLEVRSMSGVDTQQVSLVFIQSVAHRSAETQTVGALSLHLWTYVAFLWMCVSQLP